MPTKKQLVSYLNNLKEFIMGTKSVKKLYIAAPEGVKTRKKTRIKPNILSATHNKIFWRITLITKRLIFITAGILDKSSFIKS